MSQARRKFKYHNIKLSVHTDTANPIGHRNQLSESLENTMGLGINPGCSFLLPSATAYEYRHGTLHAPGGGSKTASMP